MNRDEKLAMIRDGAIECFRVSSRWLLVKVMDQVEGGRMRWQTIMVHNALEPLGARLVDRFDFLTKPMAQPSGWRANPTDADVPGRTFKGKTAEDDARAWLDSVGGGELRDMNRRQSHAAANYSTALVFRRQ